MSPRLMLTLAAVATLLAAIAGLYWKGRHDGAAHERPKTEAALAQAAVAGLETAGAKQSAQQTAAAVVRRDTANRATAHLTTEALTSEDARAPLDPARADRLRANDHQLCRTAPELAGCSAD